MPTNLYVCADGTPTPGGAPAANVNNCYDCNPGFRLAGTTCVALEIRLVGGSSPLEGRVEVFHNGEWGTVCDDGWDTTDASVVCRELGFSSDGAIPHIRAAFGQGTGQIWLDDTQCRGSEERLIDCPRHRSGQPHNPTPIGGSNCGHSEDAGVTCLSN